MPKWLQSPLICLLISALVFIIFIFGRLYQSRFDSSSFVVAGDRYCDPSRVPQSLTVLKNSAGFDGQFYYRLALNPFTRQQTEFGITLDAPALRHQRILYPLLSSMLSFGNRGLLPKVMLLLNFVALCLMGWVGGIYARALNRPAIWGLVLPLYPGFLLTLSRDTVEIFEATIVLGCLLLLRRGKPLLASVLLALAVLTKETAVLVAVAAAPVYVVERKRQRQNSPPLYFIAIPLLVFALWQFILFQNWGEFPIRASEGANLGMPFAGVFAALRASGFQRPFQLRKFSELIFLLAFGVAVLYLLRSGRSTSHEIASWVLVALLSIVLGTSVWIEDWTFMRVLSLFYILGATIIIGSERKVKYLVFGCSLSFWCLLFFKLMRSYALN